jgi:hypothetical protein
MTDRTQFEAMLEALINEDQETAKEIFHNIVVAKSREIYEELLAEDFDLEENPTDVKPEDEEDNTRESFGDDESEDDGESDDIGGDATDDFVSDIDDEEGDEEDSEGDGEGEIEDRVMDLEDALDELKAEFEQLMAGEEGEEQGDEFGGDMDDMDNEFALGEPDEMAPIDPTQVQMEYVNKVALPKHGDNGVNTKSIMAKKNDMGGTTANIAKSFSTEKGGTEGGLASPKAGDLTSGLGTIHNRVDSKAGKTAFKKKEPGHGAEKKGAADTAPDRKSLIGSRK